MFDYSIVRESQETQWLELDGLNVELVLTQHKSKREYQRNILNEEVVNTVKLMENPILDMKDGEVRKLVCNATGVTIVVGTHSVSSGEYFWLRVFIITTFRNANYKRVGFFKEGN